MDFKIAVLAGDGIGPEISVQGVDVMSAVCEKFGHKVSYEYAICGADAIGDPTLADAILDRIVHSAHKIELTGDSVRKINAKKK